MNGFPKTAEEKDIFDILLEGGLPTDFKIENVKKNDKNGQLIIDTLDPAVCISLTNHIHGNKFFNRKVYVTSVVQKTPSKEHDDVESCPNSLAGSSGSDSSSDESESDQNSTVSKPPCSSLFTKVSDQVKRPAAASPEEQSETKKKHKKKKKHDGISSTGVRSSSRQSRTANQK
jgi:hypothetical protein